MKTDCYCWRWYIYDRTLWVNAKKLVSTTCWYNRLKIGYRCTVGRRWCGYCQSALSRYYCATEYYQNLQISEQRLSLWDPQSLEHTITHNCLLILYVHTPFFFCTCIKYSNSNISEQLCYLPPGGVSYNLAHWTTCTCTCYLSKVNPLLTLKDGSSSWMCWIEHKNANTCET